MSYDSWKETAPEQDAERIVCCVCGPDHDAEPCGPECEHILDIARAGRTVARLYAACRRAMRLAREYREEERWRGRKSRRLAMVIDQVNVWRQDIRYVRLALTQREAA